MTKQTFIISGLLGLSILGAVAYGVTSQMDTPATVSATPTPISTVVLSPTPSTVPSTLLASPTPSPSLSPSLALPAKVALNVPFTPQAPNANWDAPYKEACEEASLIMVKFFLDKATSISKETADKEILDLVKYETDNGYKVDITVSQLAEVAKLHYGLSTGRVKTNATVDDIKQELAAGRPVIFPAAGRLLPNPNFRSPGPPYHMLVVKGYDATGFITNDPGTRNGNSFHYTFDVMDKALHDWDEQDIMQGQKAYLVFD